MSASWQAPPHATLAPVPSAVRMLRLLRPREIGNLRLVVFGSARASTVGFLPRRRGCLRVQGRRGRRHHGQLAAASDGRPAQGGVAGRGAAQGPRRPGEAALQGLARRRGLRLPGRRRDADRDGFRGGGARHGPAVPDDPGHARRAAGGERDQHPGHLRRFARRGGERGFGGSHCAHRLARPDPARTDAGGLHAGRHRSPRRLDRRALARDEVVAAYPSAARQAKTAGYAALSCTFGGRGRFRSCQVVAENPKGGGFGRAALALSRDFAAT
jgi:hypothetical protein